MKTGTTRFRLRRRAIEPDREAYLRSIVSVFFVVWNACYDSSESPLLLTPSFIFEGLNPRYKMPYVDLYCSDDYASIYYTTNTPCGNVGGFDAEKPTIIILHPLFLDSTWLDQQFGDPRLNDQYNLVAFDLRTCGRSTCRPSGRHDSWVEAADLALCHQVCGYAPCARTITDITKSPYIYPLVTY